MANFLERCAAGEMPLGVLFWDRNTVVLDGLAKAGYTWVIADLMYGTMDWGDVHYMCMSARSAGLVPIVRLPAYPWLASSGGAGRLAADAARAASIGAEGIMVSVRTAEDVRAIAATASDWHRVGQIQTTVSELSDHETHLHERAIIMPLVESISALEDLEAIFAIEGVNAVLMSGTDLPRQLGHPYEYEHPEVWAYLERAVDLGHQYGVAVGTNSGFVFVHPADVVDRIERLRQRGIQFVLTQSAEFMAFAYARTIIEGLNGGESP